MAEELHNTSLASTLTSEGRIILSLTDDLVGTPGEGEVLVALDAVPINPSDFLYLMGPAKMATLSAKNSASGRIVTARADLSGAQLLAGRLDRPVVVGNEGSGIVVRAGAGAEALVGRRVSALAGAMFSRYRVMPADNCLVLPTGTAANEAAGLFVNPLTALTMVEFMRLEGHKALVHTAAASNLGQMLVKICLTDGVELVNVVRSSEQRDVLLALGARHVVDSSSDSLDAELADAIAATGATIAFDAVGGGRMAHGILRAMELVGRRGLKAVGHGTQTRKQVMLYGRLDRTPLELDWDYGVDWSVGVFVMTTVLDRIGPNKAAALRERVVQEMRTTFASRYAETVGFDDLLELDVLRTIARKKTGGKFLLDPSRPIKT